MENIAPGSNLSIQSIFKDWYALIKVKGLFALGALLLVAFAYVAMIAVFVLPATVLPLDNLFVLIPWVLLYAVALFYGIFMIARAFVKIQFMIADQTSFHYADLFPSLQEFKASWRFFLLAAVWYFLIGVSFIAFIVPGLIVVLGLWPVFLKAFEENDFRLGQIKATWQLTKGYKMFFFKFFLVLFVIGFALNFVASLWTSVEPISGLLVNILVLIATSFLGATINGLLYRKISPKK